MIYLDNNATTQIHPQVLEVVNLYLQEHWGNPSSSYSLGAKEKKAIETARQNIASLINAEPAEIIFTSGATESNNMAFHCALGSRGRKSKKHLITSAVEHSSVIEISKNLQTEGYDVTYLPVDENGMIDLNDLENSITSNTGFVSLMYANNETGVIFPIKQIAKICRRKDVLLHCDAVQAVGKIPVDVNELNVDYLSLSGHKLYAPKGIGALFVKRSAPVAPLILGGGQEAGRRGGTYNTPYIAGLSLAAQLAIAQIDLYKNQIEPLRNYFENEIVKNISQVYFNGKNSLRIPNTSNIGIQGIDSDIILNYLNQYEIFISSGAACSSQTIAPSHVITAMKDYTRAGEALRISLSVNTTLEEVDMLLNKLKEAYRILA